MSTWDTALAAWAFDAFKQFVPYRHMLEDLKRVLNPTQEQLVLDAGCGTGNISSLLLRQGVRVVGLDNSPFMLKRARKKGGRSLALCLGDLNTSLPFRSQTFDAVVSIHSLYLLEDLLRSIQELRRVVKCGGKVIIVHPKPMGLWPAVKYHFAGGELKPIMTSLLPHNLLRFAIIILDSAMKAEKEYQRNFLTEQEFIKLLEESGLKVCSTLTTYGGISTVVVARR